MPLIHDITVSLASKQGSDYNVDAGNPLVISLPRNEKKTEETTYDLNLTLPDGKSVSPKAVLRDSKWVVEFADASVDGIYTISSKEYPEKYYSVMPPISEFETDYLSEKDKSEFNFKYGFRFYKSTDELFANFAKNESLGEIWKIFIFAVIVLLCLELLLGRFFAR